MITEEDLTAGAWTYLIENLGDLRKYLSKEAKEHIVLVMAGFAMKIAADVITGLRTDIPSD